MTTSEALDLLELLSSPELAEKAEQEASRPFNRFAGKHFKADIPAQELEVISRRVGNSNFDEWGMFLTVDVTEVYDGNVHTGEHQLWVRSANPAKRDGTPNKNTKNSELVQMTTAAGRSPRAWIGSKNVEFKDAIYEYTYDRNTQVKGTDGKDIWERGVKGELWYYALNFSGSVQSNGSAPAKTEPTQAAHDAAMALLVDPGMDETAFQLAASKDPIIKKDPAMIRELSSGNWARDQISTGKLLRDGSTLVQP